MRNPSTLKMHCSNSTSSSWSFGIKAFSLLLLAFFSSTAANSSTSTYDAKIEPAPLHLISLVERDLQSAPPEGQALEIIYRRRVRSLEEAATFFYSATFLRLHLEGQRQVLDQALELDAVHFLPQTRFLPFSLRQEYRVRATEAVEGGILRSLSHLNLTEEVNLYLPSHEGMRSSAAGEAAFNRPAQLRRLLRDPALRNLGEISSAVVAQVAGPFTTAEALIEAKVMIARNLDRRNMSPSEENIEKVWQEMRATRSELAVVSLFKGRNVVFAAGKEKPQDGPTFGKSTTLAALQAQSPASLALFRSGEKNAYRLLAGAIHDAPELTLFLETHGRPDALEFSGALRPDELAAMFAGRSHPERAVVIFNTCFGHDFARAFAERLHARGIESPILVVPEEFGQATIVGRQESLFTREGLGLGGQRDLATLGTLFSEGPSAMAVYATVGQTLAQIR